MQNYGADDILISNLVGNAMPSIGVIIQMKRNIISHYQITCQLMKNKVLPTSHVMYVTE